MQNSITLENILNIYENEISKTVKNKNKIYNFDVNKMQHINDIVYMLKNGLVGHTQYNLFLIYEPKCRLVMSQSIKDKVINHFITRYVLEKKLNQFLDDRNCATRKGMGTDYAIRLTKKYIEENKNKYGEFYILKIDICKYFYSIDHNVLKSLLKDKLDFVEYEMVEKIIDSTNYPYINNTIDKLLDGKNLKIPKYKYGKGLPIGNMSSQLLSIFYLYKLDHFIIHDLKLKYFVRYMDDFIIMSHDLEKLQKAKKIIEYKLRNEYKLEIHPKKTMIVNCKNGFSFLGYTYKVINHKTIIKLKKSNYERIKKKIKLLRYELDNNRIDYQNAFASIMNYSNGYKFASNLKILNLIDRYFYNEK